MVRNVVVLGGSYSGNRAAEQLASKLPSGYRVILIDKRSHFAHLYGFSRNAVLPGHSHKLFIPYTHLLNAPAVTKDSCPRNDQTRHLVVQAAATRIERNAVWVDQDLCDIIGDDSDAPFSVDQCCRQGQDGCCGDFRKTETRIPFTYLVYALGSHLPPPLATSAATKKELMSFLKVQQALIYNSTKILIIGGGALGIQYATDIKELYPDKDVTLIHSRPRLLPIFDQRLHDETLKRFEELGIHCILGDRVVLPPKLDSVGMQTLQTQGGRTISSDLRIYATGQKPNSQLLGQLSPSSINPAGFIKVKRSMQLEDPGLQHIFACGDVIEGFGAIKAGHTGWNQANIAAENIEKLVIAQEAGLSTPLLTDYEPGLPQIKVTLGLRHSVTQSVNPESPNEVVITVSDTGIDYKDDEGWRLLWQALKHPSDDPYL